VLASIQLWWRSCKGDTFPYLHHKLYKYGILAIWAGPQCLRFAPKHGINTLPGPYKQLRVLHTLGVDFSNLSFAAPQALMKAPADTMHAEKTFIIVK
jgi:hypothetical protein